MNPWQSANVDPSPVLSALKNACIDCTGSVYHSGVCILCFLPLQRVWLQELCTSSGFPVVGSSYETKWVSTCSPCYLLLSSSFTFSGNIVLITDHLLRKKIKLYLLWNKRDPAQIESCMVLPSRCVLYILHEVLICWMLKITSNNVSCAWYHT